ncbi:M14 family zinc carboxypeptidase [Hydrogenophaga taeniospiralis]|nr:M14 family zinc carboxypeptidase [Hydrogenophaga taeniospiralis]
MPHSALPELIALEKIVGQGAPHLQARVVCEVSVAAGHRFPVYAIGLGTTDPQAPAVGFFGGVHGLERIGAQVVIAFLQNVVMRLRWDQTLHRQLEQVRLVFMPIVNPGGMWAATRANPRGVDLMRNAPVEAREKVPYLLGGQRLSAGLPWYRGRLGDPMEAESQALCDVVQSELLSRPFSLALDCHSGFGVSDRLWFPYAHTREPIAHLAELHALKDIFLQAHSHHPYIIEPQSAQYLAHGDLWDHLYLRARAEHPERSFLPLTLEMGSWLWIKKNPRQLFSRKGIFNPLIDHRQQRVLRRHLSLLDFLARAACSHAHWTPSPDTRDQRHADALAHWYGAQDTP